MHSLARITHPGTGESLLSLYSLTPVSKIGMVLRDPTVILSSGSQKKDRRNLGYQFIIAAENSLTLNCLSVCDDKK